MTRSRENKVDGAWVSQGVYNGIERFSPRGQLPESDAGSQQQSSHSPSDATLALTEISYPWVYP